MIKTLLIVAACLLLASCGSSTPSKPPLRLAINPDQVANNPYLEEVERMIPSSKSYEECSASSKKTAETFFPRLKADNASRGVSKEAHANQVILMLNAMFQVCAKRHNVNIP